MDEPDNKWFAIEYDVFEYLGPRGKDLASLKTGSLDDDDADLDTSRESAKMGVKAAKKMKFDAKDPDPTDAKLMAKRAIADQLESHTRMASMRLVIQYGSAEQKDIILKEILKSIMTTTEVDT